MSSRDGILPVTRPNSAPAASTPNSEPDVWEAVEADPAIPLEPEVLRMVTADQQGWTRTWLYPLARPLSRLAVLVISVGKRVVPIRWTAHGTMDRLCLWFLRRFVSSLAVELLIRHFVIETNLLNFIVRNADLTGLEPVGLRPTTLAGLGNRAVIQHDLNVYDVIIAIRRRAVQAAPDLDYSGVDVPELDPEPTRRRLLNLDIQTALCLMNIPFALCLAPDEYRRAVHSIRFDDSILTILADLTGDETFLRWRAGHLSIRLDSRTDVPATVYRHAVICEYAHAHLTRMSSTGRSLRPSRLDLPGCTNEIGGEPWPIQCDPGLPTAWSGGWPKNKRRAGFRRSSPEWFATASSSGTAGVAGWTASRRPAIPSTESARSPRPSSESA